MAVDVIQETFTLISSGFTTMQASGATMMQNSLSIGLSITGALFVWAMLWNLVEWFAASDMADVVLSFLNTFFTTAILVFLFAGGFYLSGNGIKGVATTGADELASKVTGNDASKSTELALQVLSKSENDLLQAVWSDDGKDGPVKSILNAVGNPLSMFMWVTKFAFRLLITVAAMGLLTICALMFLAIYAASEIYILIALIVGPVLLPWVLWERFSFLPDGWTRWGVSSILLKLVATIMLTLTGSMLSGISQAIALYKQHLADGSAAGAVAGNFADLIALGPLLLWLLLMIVLLLKTENIAQGLVSGSLPTLGMRMVRVRRRNSPSGDSNN